MMSINGDGRDDTSGNVGLRQWITARRKASGSGVSLPNGALLIGRFDAGPVNHANNCNDSNHRGPIVVLAACQRSINTR